MAVEKLNISNQPLRLTKDSIAHEELSQGTRLANNILNNEIIQNGLFTEGKSKNLILKHIASKLDDCPGMQPDFIRTIFMNLAEEGSPEITNRRDAAFEVITDNESIRSRLNEIMTPIIKSNQTTVFSAYIDALHQQTANNDPYAGSIYTLLEITKAIAPYLPRDYKNKQLVIEAWNKLADQFNSIEKKVHIRLNIKTIMENMTQYKQIKKRKTSRRITAEDKTQLDIKVEQLRKNGMHNFEIADLINKNLSDIEQSASRLIASGRIEPHPKGKTRSEAITNLDIQVEALRNQGLRNRDIANLLNKKTKAIQNSIHRLIKTGKIKLNK